MFGSFLAFFGILLFIAFVSFFFTGEADQSSLSDFATREVKSENWLSKSGAWLSDLFIQRGFGVASFIIAVLIFISGIYFGTEYLPADVEDVQTFPLKPVPSIKKENFFTLDKLGFF